jgi:hypothetical protein
MLALARSLEVKWTLQVDLDFAVPTGLCPGGRIAVEAILEMLASQKEWWPYWGYQVFYEPNTFARLHPELDLKLKCVRPRIKRPPVLVVLHHHHTLLESYFDASYGVECCIKQRERMLRQHDLKFYPIGDRWSAIVPAAK